MLSPGFYETGVNIEIDCPVLWELFKKFGIFMNISIDNFSVYRSTKPDTIVYIINNVTAFSTVPKNLNQVVESLIELFKLIHNKYNEIVEGSDKESFYDSSSAEDPDNDDPFDSDEDYEKYYVHPEILKLMKELYNAEIARAILESIVSVKWEVDIWGRNKKGEACITKSHKFEHPINTSGFGNNNDTVQNIKIPGSNVKPEDYLCNNIELSSKKAIKKEVNPNSATALRKVWSVEDNPDGTLTIKGYKGSDTKIVIPETIGAKVVTCIKNEAFLKNSKTRSDLKITEIIIPNSVTQIGESAFAFSSIESITLPTNLCVISEMMFQCCSQLRNIVIPQGVTKIERDAFMNCFMLENIVLCVGLIDIGSGSFANCSNLQTIGIPSSVKSIGNDAFRGCKKITNLIVPKSVKKIEERAFDQCDNLVSITIPDCQFSNEGDIWGSCPKLENIIIEPDSKFFAIKDGALYNKNLSKLIKLPAGLMRENFIVADGVTEIAPGAFKCCTTLKSVVLPNSVIEIGHQAFSDCIALYDIILPKSVTKIGYGAFEGCKDLQSIMIPSGVLSLESSTFSWCSNLKNIIIPESVKIIEDYAFFRCGRLKNIQAPERLIEAIKRKY